MQKTINKAITIDFDNEYCDGHCKYYDDDTFCYLYQAELELGNDGDVVFRCDDCIDEFGEFGEK